MCTDHTNLQVSLGGQENLLVISIATDGEFSLLSSFSLIILLTDISWIIYSLKDCRATVERVCTQPIAADGRFFHLLIFSFISLLTGISQRDYNLEAAYTFHRDQWGVLPFTDFFVNYFTNQYFAGGGQSRL